MAASQEFKFKCQKIEARIAKGNKNTECCEHEWDLSVCQEKSWRDSIDLW